jgi:sugar phosphate isomerase/epimerase
MYLALNTFVYEVAGVRVEETLRSAARLGFRFIEYAAYHSGDPTYMSRDRQTDLVRLFEDLGLVSSQMLLINAGDIASPDPVKRQRALDYMKRCTEFQLELGGKQVLVCRGCGIHQSDMLREQAWVNMVASLRDFAQWGLDSGVLVDLEIEPHVYFVVNSTAKAAQAIEDISLPNVFANADFGHLSILREGPGSLEKLKDRIIHVHLSETDAFEHTNSILGTGVTDFKSYVDKVVQLGIEETCQRVGEDCVAGIEMGARAGFVDDPERWIQESLGYLADILPELST